MFEDNRCEKNKDCSSEKACKNQICINPYSLRNVASIPSLQLLTVLKPVAANMGMMETYITGVVSTYCLFCVIDG